MISFSAWRAIKESFLVLFLLRFTLVFFAADAHAQSPNRPDKSPATTQMSPESISSNERFLFESLNHERATRGLAALHWDAHLASAAHLHAQRMVETNDLSHQLPGEPELLTRLSSSGAKFTSIAENIAEGSDTLLIHDGWMHSPGHRANILDPQSTAVGIAVVEGSRQLFAVQDFSRAAEILDFAELEKRISTLLAAHGLKVENKSTEARRSCDADFGMPGVTSMSLIRFETGDLTSLPAGVAKRIDSGSFQKAAVGACSVPRTSGFAHYRLVILLY
jgi:uncharacterized protein YkwD